MPRLRVFSAALLRPRSILCQPLSHALGPKWSWDGENPQGCVHSPKGRHVPTLMSNSVSLHGSEHIATVSMWDRQCWGGGREHSLGDSHGKTPQAGSAALCLLQGSSPGEHHHHHQAPCVCQQICMAHSAVFLLSSCRGASQLLFLTQTHKVIPEHVLLCKGLSWNKM